MTAPERETTVPPTATLAAVGLNWLLVEVQVTYSPDARLSVVLYEAPVMLFALAPTDDTQFMLSKVQPLYPVSSTVILEPNSTVAVVVVSAVVPLGALPLLQRLVLLDVAAHEGDGNVEAGQVGTLVIRLAAVPVLEGFEVVQGREGVGDRWCREAVHGGGGGFLPVWRDRLDQALPPGRRRRLLMQMRFDQVGTEVRQRAPLRRGPLLEGGEHMKGDGDREASWVPLGERQGGQRGRHRHVPQDAREVMQPPGPPSSLAEAPAPSAVRRTQIRGAALPACDSPGANRISVSEQIPGVS